MKASLYVKLIILLFYSSACVDKNSAKTDDDSVITDTSIAVHNIPTDTFKTGMVITPVFCKANPAQSYALYIPPGGNNPLLPPGGGNRQPLPVIYFFDPHGDGSLPLVKYKTLADKYNFILIGSNDSKNGNDLVVAESIWEGLFDDSQRRLKVDTNRLYVCGFSGGAKVASYIGLNHREIKGVIVNGAGLPEATGTGNFNFSFTAIAGEGDMNMTDLMTMSNNLDKTQTRHRIIYFDGKHEWAPANTMDIAFAGLQFDAIHDKLIPVNDSFTSGYIVASKNRIAIYSKAHNYIKTEEECKLSISMLNGLTSEVNWFAKKDDSLKNDPVYKKKRQKEQELFVTEQNIKAEYMRQFQQGDMNYWDKTISDLQIKAQAKTADGAMCQRLLAYLSLAFYSISNQLITGKQDKDALYFVKLYKLADVTNNEAWYFSAILNARNNNAKAAEADLLKAVSHGFSDKNRMMLQPEFQRPGIQINLTKIADKMSKSN